MMRYTSSKEHTLAQKHRLGIPIRKYQFHPTHSYASNAIFPIVKVSVILLLSTVSIGVGLYLDISTTIEARVEWMWPWIVGAICVPTVFGLIVHRMGYKRLARLNGAATIVSFFLVTLCTSFYFVQNLSMHPIAYILIGIFLQSVGLIILWVEYNAIGGLSSILMCTDGCLAISRMNRVYAIHWESVTAFWDRRQNAKIVCANGTKLTISYQWPNGIAARDLIYGKVFRHIRARALSAYEAGEPFSFGKFTVSQRGINNGRHQLLWDDIHECAYMEEGVALIDKDTKWLEFISFWELPNAVVFVSLINAIIKSHIAQKAYSHSEV